MSQQTLVSLVQASQAQQGLTTSYFTLQNHHATHLVHAVTSLSVASSIVLNNNIVDKKEATLREKSLREPNG